MQSRPARAALLVLLLAAAAAAAWVAWDLNRYARTLGAQEQELALVLDRAIDTLTGISAGQQAYLDPGQPLRPSFDRVSTYVQQLYRDTATLGQYARSATATGQVDALESRISLLVQTDAYARELLRTGEADAAAAVIRGDAAAQSAAAVQQLERLRDAETGAFQMAHGSAGWQRWAALGIAVLLAALGVGLSRAPAGQTGVAAAAPAVPGPGIDMAAVASVCTALSRVASADVPPDLLARAAAALDAPGLIVWLERSGVLTAVAAHGYEASAVSRMGPLARTADNATADAWRTGTTRTVAGHGPSRAAIVVPMLGPGRCLGVIAAEVTPGTEADPARLAAASILAAQLTVTFGGKT